MLIIILSLIIIIYRHTTIIQDVGYCSRYYSKLTSRLWYHIDIDYNVALKKKNVNVPKKSTMTLKELFKVIFTIYLFLITSDARFETHNLNSIQLLFLNINSNQNNLDVRRYNLDVTTKLIQHSNM